MEQAIAKQVESVARRVEEQIDGELDRLNNLEIDDLASIRQKRLQEMKKKAQQQLDWKQNGHGEYSQIPDQKAFFDVCKGSERVVVHFFRKSSPRCDIFDMHLKILANKHIETRFCKIDAEKSPFLCERLLITVLPTLLLLRKDVIIGAFCDDDHQDDFSTELLEWVLTRFDIVEKDKFNSLMEQQAIAKQVESVARRVEEQIDGELDRLNNLEIDDLASTLQKRLQEMKKEAQLQLDWKQNGHGEYSQIPDQKAFFDVCKGSERVIVHFFRKSSPRCDIFDMHLKILANKHIETRFCKIDAEKSHFLCELLLITVLPTLLLLKDAKSIAGLIGFSDLDNKDDFSTELLEWVMAQYDMVEYQGDKDVRPTGKKQKSSKDILKSFSIRKNIRGKEDDSGSDLDSDN